MTTPASETLHVPLQYIQEYLAGEAGRLQQPLDDAIIRAEQNAQADQLIKTVVVEIVPSGATVPGEIATVKWGMLHAQEYLRPPGDSVRLQPQINNPMTVMARSAVTNNTVTQLIIEINPAA
jgi:hypothetical protein